MKRKRKEKERNSLFPHSLSFVFFFLHRLQVPRGGRERVFQRDEERGPNGVSLLQKQLAVPGDGQALGTSRSEARRDEVRESERREGPFPHREAQSVDAPNPRSDKEREDDGLCRGIRRAWRSGRFPDGNSRDETCCSWPDIRARRVQAKHQRKPANEVCQIVNQILQKDRQ